MALSRNSLVGGTYNLMGGTSDDARSRMLADLRELAELGLDFLGVQEFKHADWAYWEALHEAEAILGMRGIPVRSNSYGCHLVTFIRERRLRVVQQRHETHLWFHALNRVRVRVDRPAGAVIIDLVNVHLSPAAGDLRTIEAKRLKLTRGPGHRVVAFGDFNARGEDDPIPPLNGHDPEQAADKLNTEAAAALRINGLLDVGAHRGDRTPTVGHASDTTLPLRVDRFHSDLHPDTFAGHTVLSPMGSDHCGVLIEFALDRDAW
ncbi:endonuclease/exonuclease/phosphatase family protein [Actinomadura viridis]|uniref:endonuclease/exonuclease/phosphatase family protein n=1 Tax=Actinomadura viridis TaxID=58110 RepID=UPI0036BAA844